MGKIRTTEQFQKCPTCTGMFRPRELARHQPKCKGFKIRKQEKETTTMSCTDLGFRRYQADEPEVARLCEFHEKPCADLLFLRCSGGAAGDVYLCPSAYIEHINATDDTCGICNTCENCPASLTECDVEVRTCTQCGWPIDETKPVYFQEKEEPHA